MPQSFGWRCSLREGSTTQLCCVTTLQTPWIREALKRRPCTKSVTGGGLIAQPCTKPVTGDALVVRLKVLAKWGFYSTALPHYNLANTLCNKEAPQHNSFTKPATEVGLELLARYRLWQRRHASMHRRVHKGNAPHAP
eukprot:1156850-Pelagomonas_calceolata.AAC.17